MKKRIILVLMVTLLPAGMLSAKSIGLSLDIAGQYTNHEIHIGSNGTKGRYHHDIYGEHMGGFDLALTYDVSKNWGIFLDTAFSFNYSFVNDTMLGFGYNFDLGKGFNAFVGGGFAFGGKISPINSKVSINYAYVGAGVKGDIAYMLTRSVGLFAGINLNLYAVIQEGNSLSKTFARSLNPKLGLRIKF